MNDGMAELESTKTVYYIGIPISFKQRTWYRRCINPP